MSYFSLELEMPKNYNYNKECKDKKEVILPKFNLVEMLRSCHGYDVLKDNPWFKCETSFTPKKNNRVSFKLTEIFGRDPILPQCRENLSCTVQRGNLHADGCPNALEEVVEILGQHSWMSREFLIKCRFDDVTLHK